MHRHIVRSVPSAEARALVAEVELVRTLAVKNFSATLKPEGRAFVSVTTDFLEGFKGFVSNSSLSEVLSLAVTKLSFAFSHL
jgi:hypothetical protein